MRLPPVAVSRRRRTGVVLPEQLPADGGGGAGSSSVSEESDATPGAPPPKKRRSGACKQLQSLVRCITQALHQSGHLRTVHLTLCHCLSSPSSISAADGACSETCCWALGQALA